MSAAEWFEVFALGFALRLGWEFGDTFYNLGRATYRALAARREGIPFK